MIYSYILGISIGVLQAKYKIKAIGYVYIGGCLYFFLMQDPRRTAFSFSYPVLSAFILATLKGCMLVLGNKIYDKIKNT
jgi:hypothetical protein